MNDYKKVKHVEIHTCGNGIIVRTLWPVPMVETSVFSVSSVFYTIYIQNKRINILASIFAWITRRVIIFFTFNYNFPQLTWLVIHILIVKLIGPNHYLSFSQCKCNCAQSGKKNFKNRIRLEKKKFKFVERKSKSTRAIIFVSFIIFIIFLSLLRDFIVM